MKKIAVTQEENAPVPVEILAKHIVAMSEGIRKLLAGPLNEKALVLLIQNAAPAVGGAYGRSKIGATEVKAVIEGIEALERTYLRKKAKP